MGAIAISILIVVMAGAAIALAATLFVRRRHAKSAITRAKWKTLLYTVPGGYDPADVILRLHAAGYEAVPDIAVGHTAQLLIGGRRDKPPDREDIRRILAEIAQHSPLPRGDWHSAIRFMDE